MTLSITPLDYSSIFTIDLMSSTDSELAAEAPSRPLETGTNATNYATIKPRTFKASGKMTFAPAVGQPGPQRVADAVRRLQGYVNARQPVMWITPQDQAVVWLTAVKPTFAPKDGLAVALDLQAEEYQTVKPTSTTMPRARLKPAVRPGSAPGEGGGASSKPSSLLYKVFRRG